MKNDEFFSEDILSGKLYNSAVVKIAGVRPAL